MTDFVTLDSSHLGVDRIATSPTAFALYENLFAFAEKAVGAPVLANSYVVEAMLSSGIVSQGKLKTTTGDVGNSVGYFTLPGGSYGFYPQLFGDTFGNPIGHAMFLDTTTSVDVDQNPTALIYLGTVGGGVARARQRYIQSSPPYDLGDGEVPFFIFAVINSNGSVESVYMAEDPPWANNGRTSIAPDMINSEGKPMRLIMPKPDIQALRDSLRNEQEKERLATARPYFVEVTQELKQADMARIPHPFKFGNDLTGKIVSLLDPMSDIMVILRDLNAQGDDVISIVTEYLAISNTPLSRHVPRGVMAVSARWR